MDKTELGPEFLYAEDLLQGGKWITCTLTISAVIPPGTIAGSDKKVIQNHVLEFEKTPKKLVLNNTNKRLCKVSTGESRPENWPGHKIEIYPASINAFGEKNLPCLRIKLPTGKPAPFATRKFMGRDLTKEAGND